MDVLKQMVERHEAATVPEKKTALKEIIQEAALCGLAQAGFFDFVALHGGSSLRIFYGSDRFSEDLDFNLVSGDPDAFDFCSYFDAVESMLRSIGLNVTVEKKVKSADTPILSAYIKGNARELMTAAYGREVGRLIIHNEKIRVKFDVSAEPSENYGCEEKSLDLPMPCKVCVLDISTLYAGKVSAVLERQWRRRIKGRDLYDYVFYINQGYSVSLDYVKFNLVKSEYIDESFDMTRDGLISLLDKKFDGMTKADFDSARDDIYNFIPADNPEVELWDSAYFKAVTKNIKTK